MMLTPNAWAMRATLSGWRGVPVCGRLTSGGEDKASTLARSTLSSCDFRLKRCPPSCRMAPPREDFRLSAPCSAGSYADEDEDANELALKLGEVGVLGDDVPAFARNADGCEGDGIPLPDGRAGHATSADMRMGAGHERGRTRPCR